MLKLLFIEDDPDAVKPVQNLIKRERADMQFEMSGFEVAEDKIASFRPDIVILDLLVVSASKEPEPGGLNTRDFIWNKHFCPIVVYSAQPDILDNTYESHPFVKSVQKGSGSPQKVLKALDALRPQIDALNRAEESVRHSFSCAMRDVAPYAFEAFSDDEQRIEVIKRSGRRRLAALMDELSMDGTALASWEQYLFPPVCGDTQLGDVLRKKEGGSNDPASFRVVLTPSCDLVKSGNRQPKVSNVLVARCCSMKSGLDLTSLRNIGISKLKDRLRSAILTPGYFEAILPFPCLERRIPTMAANLQDLELIPIQDIGDIDSDKSVFRIASIDSPFRELVAWAYLQTACRPGLPNRDFNLWRDEVVANIESEAGGEET